MLTSVLTAGNEGGRGENVMWNNLQLYTECCKIGIMVMQRKYYGLFPYVVINDY